MRFGLFKIVGRFGFGYQLRGQRIDFYSVWQMFTKIIKNEVHLEASLCNNNSPDVKINKAAAGEVDSFPWSCGLFAIFAT